MFALNTITALLNEAAENMTEDVMEDAAETTLQMVGRFAATGAATGVAIVGVSIVGYGTYRIGKAGYNFAKGFVNSAETAAAPENKDEAKPSAEAK